VGEADTGDFEILHTDLLAERFQGIKVVSGIFIPRKH